MGLYIIILVLALAVLFMLAKLIINRRELLRIKDEMARYRQENMDFSSRLTVEVNDSGIISLVEEINELMDSYRNSLTAINAAEKEFKRMITDLSHDIRTPLTSIAGYIQLLKKNGMTDETRKYYLDIIENKSKRMRAITDELFEFSIVEGDEFEYNPAKEDPASILLDVITDFHDEIKQKFDEPLIEIEDTPYYILADRALLRRVFVNLIQNSLKYGEGRLSFKLYFNNKLYIEIANGAENLTQEEAKRLFGRFYRSDASRSTAGSGLGLNIAKKLVENMKGEISSRHEDGMLKIVIEFPVW